jgi:hypothetical protein
LCHLEITLVDFLQLDLTSSESQFFFRHSIICYPSCFYFKPPEINKDCPVAKPVFANITTAFATSPGSHNLPIGIFSTTPGTLFSSGISPVPPTMAGATSLQLMLNGPSWTANLLVNDWSPPLLAASVSWESVLVHSESEARISCIGCSRKCCRDVEVTQNQKT